MTVFHSSPLLSTTTARNNVWWLTLWEEIHYLKVPGMSLSWWWMPRATTMNCCCTHPIIKYDNKYIIIIIINIIINITFYKYIKLEVEYTYWVAIILNPDIKWIQIQSSLLRTISLNLKSPYLSQDILGVQLQCLTNLPENLNTLRTGASDIGMGPGPIDSLRDCRQKSLGPRENT